MARRSAFEWDDRAFQAACDRVASRGARMRPMLYEIMLELERSTKARFDLEISPDGDGWVDLAPDTWKRKRSPKKLQEGGYLKGGIAVLEVTDDAGEIGADREYAAIQQYGGSPEMAPGPAAVPARPYLGISDDDALMILRAAEAYLGEAFGPS